MENQERNIRVCPKCGMEYKGRPAVSRVDNATAICPDCGTREALDLMGVPVAEQNEIIALIHQKLG